MKPTKRQVFVAARIAAVVGVLAAFIGYHECRTPEPQQQGFVSAGGGFVPPTGFPGVVQQIINSGKWALTGEQADTSTGTINNFVLNANVSVLRWSGASTGTFTGITGGTNGRVLFVINESATNSMIFNHETGTSTTSNRFTLRNASTMGISPQGGVVLRYDGTSSRWRVVSLNTAQLNDNLNAVGAILSGATISFSSSCSASLSGTVTGWSPGSCMRYRITPTAAVNLYSMTSGASNSGRLIWINNLAGSGFNVAIKNDDGATGTAAERFTPPGSVDLVIPPGASTWLFYDTTTSRWIPFGGNGTYSQASNSGQGNFAGLWTTGRFYRTSLISTSTSAVLGVGNMRCTPVYVPNPITAVSLTLNITVAGEAGSHMRQCLYGDSGAMRPNALVADAGQVLADSTGNKTQTISAAIGPGFYWTCGVVQDVVTTQPTVTVSTQQVLPTIDTFGLTNAFSGQAGFAQSGVTATCPGTFSSVSFAGTAPIIAIGT